MKDRITGRGAKRALCLLLCCCLLLGLPTGASAEETKLVTVSACRLFDDSLQEKVLLRTDAGYFITLEDAQMLGGFDGFDANGSGYSFYAGGIARTAETARLAYRDYGGERFYELEALMQQLDVFVCASDEGLLLVNPVARNIADLLTETERMLERNSESPRYCADPLADSGLLGIASYVVGLLYNTVTKMRLDVLWGGAYQDDIEGLTLDLMKPMDSEKTVMETVEKANKKLDKATKHLLEAQEVYEQFRELVTLGEIPAGSDPFLFSQDGTWGLRESAEAIHAVNSGDFFAMKDLLAVSSYVTGTIHASSAFVLAMNRVMAASSAEQRRGYPIMADTAARVSRDCRLTLERETYGAAAVAVEQYFSTVADNLAKHAVKDVLKETSLAGIFTPVASLTLAAISVVANLGWDCDSRVKAVMSARRLAIFQDLLTEVYEEQLFSRMSGENAMIARDAVLMYLRCAWNGYNYFKFDKEIAGAVSHMKSLIGDEICILLDFPDGMFLSMPNAPIASGRLREAGEQTSALSGSSVRQQYYELIASGRFLDDFEARWLFTPWEGFTLDSIWSDAYLYDVDGNGVEELILVLTASMAETSFVLYTCGEQGPVCVCGDYIQGDSVFSANRSAGAVAIEGYHGGWGTMTIVQIWDDTLLNQYYGDGDYESGAALRPEDFSPDLAGSYEPLTPHPLDDLRWLWPGE